jgi:hypothetical protein
LALDALSLALKCALEGVVVVGLHSVRAQLALTLRSMRGACAQSNPMRWHAQCKDMCLRLGR